MPKKTIYQATPDIYENDLHNVVQAIDEIKLAIKRCDEVFLMEADISLWSKNDYPIGTLRLDDDQWVFTPHNDSAVEA